MTHKITWKWIEESMFPLTMNDCRRAGIDVSRWALAQPENSGRALVLVEGTAQNVLMRFDTPADADRFMQGMRFTASRVTVPDVHPHDTTDAGDTAGSAFTLTVDTGNAAFHDVDNAEVPAPGPELARILRDVADRVEYAGPGGSGRVADVNGNHVGRWEHATGE